MTKEQLKADIEKRENRLKVGMSGTNKLDKEDIAFAEKKIKSLKAELKALEDAEKKAPKKAEPAAKKAEPHKFATKPTPKPKAAHKFAAAPVKKASKPAKNQDPDCDELLERYHAAMKSRKKSAKNAKKASSSENIGRSFALAISKAIKSIPAEKIKKAPADFKKKMQSILAKVKSAFESMRGLLGTEYSKIAFNNEIEPIVELINKLKEKYSD